MKSALLLLFSCIVCLNLTAKESPKIKKIDGFVYVPSGSYQTDNANISIMSFWMSECEVTNPQYREFLSDLKTQNRTTDFNRALPDTAAWKISESYMQPMVDLYFNHPAYNNYPVVNISTEGANLYCQWLAEKLKAELGSGISLIVRLPLQVEWTYAASGNLPRAIYSWSGPYLRDEKGCFLANFKSIGDENITTVDSLPQLIKGVSAQYFVDGAELIAPSKTYLPNAFGLFNMSGNVSELVIKPQQGDVQRASQQVVAIGGNWNSTGYDIRITSEIPFEKANPFVGSNNKT